VRNVRRLTSLDGLDAALLVRLLAMARGRSLPLSSAVAAASGLDGRPRLGRAVARLALAGEDGLLDALGDSLRAGRDAAAAASLESLRRTGLPASGLLELSRWLSARESERSRFLRAIGYPLSISVTACFLTAILFHATVGLFTLGEVGREFGVYLEGAGESADRSGPLRAVTVLSMAFAQWLGRHPAGILAWSGLVLAAAAAVALFGSRIQDRSVALAIPGLRNWVRLACARAFCETLHVLLRSGVPAPEALAAASAAVPNASLRRRLAALAEKVAGGEGLGELFRTATALPPFVRWRLWSAYFRSDLADELSRATRALAEELRVSETRLASLGTAVSWCLALLALAPVFLFVYGMTRLPLELVSRIG
jgi:type II secretory pathway component PulF